MIVSQVAPRHCRRALFRHASRTGPALCRALATEVEATEVLLGNHLREAASLSPVSSSPDLPPPRPSRRKNGPPRDPIVDAYLNYKHMQRTTGRYGSQLAPFFQPHTVLTNPPRPADVTLELLLASQAHLGHSTSLWNPANSRYIFGIREGIHIISLDVTAAHLRRAAKVVSGVAERGGLILFVGTRPGFDRCVVRAAELAGACHLFERWTPGSITNGQQILGKCRMKVIDEYDNIVPGFEEQLFERSALKPDLVVCLNPLENKVMLSECALANIPTIGIIDTDANPTWVTYPIPANDDSLRCVQVIAGVLGRAGEEGQARRLEAAKEGRITYLPTENLILPEDWEEQHDEDAANDSLSTPDAAPFGEPRERVTREQAAARTYESPLMAVMAKLSTSEITALLSQTMTDEGFRVLQRKLSAEEWATLQSAMPQQRERRSGIALEATDADTAYAQRREDDEEGVSGTYDGPLMAVIAKLSDSEVSALLDQSMTYEGFRGLQAKLTADEWASLQSGIRGLDDPETAAGEDGEHVIGYNVESEREGSDNVSAFHDQHADDKDLEGTTSHDRGGGR